jgi:hypothetical protein
MLWFELHDEDCVGDNGKPMVIHRRYTWSMNEKSKLREHLEAWRGQPFTEKDFGTGGFDICNLLGKPCFLVVAHSVSATSGKTNAKIDAISKLRKDMKVGELVNDKEFISLDPEQFKREAFEKLPDWVKDEIKLSPEYRRLNGNGADNDGDGAHDWQAPPHEDSEIPF